MRDVSSQRKLEKLETALGDRQIKNENDWIIDSLCSNHVIGDKVKLYKDLKVRGTPVMERHKMEIVNVMLAEEVYENKNVLPDIQELQEKLQTKVHLDSSQDVANLT
ncbi:hypothetical protein LIER_24156 [Lithospermum erythrorhizon]|uniref:Uncharacterized protein n=1 Tax=Lithospermum erythrorhizon TaxID=34254 RepID=A0AAV3R4B9_LITER